MRLPDRPEAGNLDSRQRDLAERLLRLPDGHPSSPRGDWTPAPGEDADSVREHGAAELGSADAAPPERIAGDEPDSDEAPTEEDQVAADPVADDPAARGPSAPARLAGQDAGGDGGDGGHDPYRPWFAGDSAPEPWFAAGQHGLAVWPEGPTALDG